MLNGWNGKDISALELPLHFAATELATVGEQHLAYPVLQFFHASDPQKSPIVQLLRLEQLLILIAGLSGEARPPRPAVCGRDSAINSFVAALPPSFRHDVQEPLRVPSLEPLKPCGIPLAPESEFKRALSAAEDRRWRLASVLMHDGWDQDSAGL